MAGNLRAQGALEYLLLIGGAVLVAVIVIVLILSVTNTAGETTCETTAKSLCVQQAALTGSCSGSVNACDKVYVCSGTPPNCTVTVGNVVISIKLSDGSSCYGIFRGCDDTNFQTGCGTGPGPPKLGLDVDEDGYYEQVYEIAFKTNREIYKQTLFIPGGTYNFKFYFINDCCKNCGEANEEDRNLYIHDVNVGTNDEPLKYGSYSGTPPILCQSQGYCFEISPVTIS